MTDAQTFTVLVSPGPCSGVKGDVVVSASSNPVTLADWGQIGLFAAGLAEPTNECQRSKADCSPAPCGDGPGPKERITIADWVRAGIYAAALDTPPLVSGCALTLPPPPQFEEANSHFQVLRTLSLTNAIMARGMTNYLSCVLNAQGNEGGLGFSIHFDTDVLTFVSASRGADTAHAPHFLVNTQEMSQGRIGLTFLLEPGMSLAAGDRTVAILCFSATHGTDTVTTPLVFLNNPITCEVSDAFGDRLPTAFDDATVSLVSDFRFATITRSLNGHVSLRLVGPTGVFDVQRSTNLRDWETVRRLTNTIGQIDYIDPNPTDAQYFYRGLKQP